MDHVDPKLIKKLAAVCRKAGIQSFKGYGVEFTLSDSFEPKSSKKVSNKSNSYSDTKFETDSLTDEQLLMWSSSVMPEDNEQPEQG